MNLNSVDWSKAQDLLVKLVQVLTPLTLRTVPASFFLNRRFLIPSGLTQDDSQVTAMRHPVRLLTTLHSMQEQVEKLIGETPQEDEVRERQLRPVTRNPKEERTSFPKDAPPLSKQAQKLIIQVQDAIGKLATSENIQDPKDAPLREALKKLKPNLDRIIDAVVHDKENPPESSKSSSFRHLVPRSYREELLRSFISNPPVEAQTKPIEEVILSQPDPQSPQVVQKTGEERPIEFKPQAPTPRPVSIKDTLPSAENGIPTHKKLHVDGRGGEGVLRERRGPKESSADRKPIPANVEAEKSARPENHQEAKAAPRPAEAISLPGAPFVSIAKNLIHPRKKKRKGFWFKGEQEEDRNNS